MAHEVIKTIVRSKLPKRQICSPEVLQLLANLYRASTGYYQQIVVPFRRLDPGQRRALAKDPRILQADTHVKEILASLREKGVNLYGMDSMDFCEAFIEVYPDFAGTR